MFFLLPALGAVRYVRSAHPPKKNILTSIISLISAVYFLFWIFTAGLGLINVSGALSATIEIILPFTLFFFIPAWFTIPIISTSPRLPQLLATLAPLVLLIPFIISVSGLSRQLPMIETTIFLKCIGAVVCTLAGILLALLASRHPEIAETPDQ